MASLNKVMTQQEAECFLALRRWQRVYQKQRLRRAIFPHPPFLKILSNTNLLGKCMVIFFAIFLSPLLLLIWILNALRAIVVFPFMLLSSYSKPAGLRAPGERNIKGLHYQFSKHINLPPELYVKCIDDWVRILYGPSKLPKHSLANYLDSDYLLRRRVAYEEDSSMKQLLKTQISNAREDLSRDLGCY